jgi:hypothetical protein
MKKSILILSMIVLISSCKKEAITEYDCSNHTPTYTADVKPILDGNCMGSGCHSSSRKAAGYDLSNYNGALNASGKDAFLGAIQHKTGYKKMPRFDSKLSEENIKTISCWVQNGAPE